MDTLVTCQQAAQQHGALATISEPSLLPHSTLQNLTPGLCLLSAANPPCPLGSVLFLLQTCASLHGLSSWAGRAMGRCDSSAWGGNLLCHSIWETCSEVLSGWLPGSLCSPRAQTALSITIHAAVLALCGPGALGVAGHGESDLLGWSSPAVQSDWPGGRGSVALLFTQQVLWDRP